MSNYYCSACGGATPFTFSKPKFCSFCGEKTEKETAAFSPKSKIFHRPLEEKRKITKATTEEEYGEEEWVPQIDKLSFEISVQKQKGEKFGAVAAQEKTGFNRERGEFNEGNIYKSFFPSSSKEKPIKIGNDD